MHNVNSQSRIRNTHFIGPRAEATGRGMYNGDSNTNLENVVFEYNRSWYSDGGGGGLGNSGSHPVLLNVTFFGNSAFGDGGGIRNSYSNPLLQNVEVNDNSSSFYGGGIYNYASDPLLINVTIVSNKCTNMGGGGIYNNDSDPDLTNVIIWNNGAGVYISTIENNQSNPVIRHSLLQESGGSENWNPDFGTDAGNNLDVYPEFYSLVDLRLHDTSPAIDRGLNSAVSSIDIDMAGSDRIQGCAVDMGIYEMTPLNDLACMRIDKTVVPKVVLPGNAVTYTLQYENSSYATLTALGCGHHRPYTSECHPDQRKFQRRSHFGDTTWLCVGSRSAITG